MGRGVGTGIWVLVVISSIGGVMMLVGAAVVAMGSSVGAGVVVGIFVVAALVDGT